MKIYNNWRGFFPLGVGHSSPKGHLWHTVHRYSLCHLGGRRIPMVGTSQSPAAFVDALGQEAISFDGLPRTATTNNQSGHHRPETGREETKTAQESLWPNQTWHITQAPYSHQNRPLGCEYPRLYPPLASEVLFPRLSLFSWRLRLAVPIAGPSEDQSLLAGRFPIT